MERNQNISQVKAISCHKEKWVQELEHFNHSLFMLPEWLEVVETPKRIPIYFDIESNNKLIGKASGLIIKDNRIKGKQLFFYSGPSLIHNDAEIYNQCLDAIKHFATQHRFSRISMLYFDHRLPHKPQSPHFRSYVMVESIIHLQTDYCDFKPGSSLRKKRNTAIRVQTSYFHSRETKELNRLSELAEITLNRRKKRHQSDYKKLEFPYFTEDLLPKLMKSGLGNMYCTMNPDGLTHFISVTMEHKNSSYGLFNGCDEFGYQNGLPGYLILQLSQEYQKKGFERFNLGGAPAISNERGKLIQFKEETGGKLNKLYVAKTDFLVFPQNAMNPFINLARKMPYNHISRKLSQLLRY
jgi:hypothetical protein